MNTAHFLKAFRPRLARLHPTSFRSEQATIPRSLRNQQISKVAEYAKVKRRNPTLNLSQKRCSSKASFPKPLEQPQGSHVKHTGPHSPPEPAQLSLSQRLRKLSREYGWSVLGVYLALTALDFPFCFLAVRWLGTDRIGHWEHVAVEWVKTMTPEPVRAGFHNLKGKLMRQISKNPGYGEPIDGTVAVPMGLDLHGIEEAERENKGENASIWTQLALAYAIHKSFIFVRVPMTAALTPKVVKTLRGWGWNIGKRKPKVSRDV